MRKTHLRPIKSGLRYYYADSSNPRRVWFNGQEVSSICTRMLGSSHPGVITWGKVELIQGPTAAMVRKIDGKMFLEDGRLRFITKRGRVRWEPIA